MIGGDTQGTMVTALAWVSRGYAKPLLDVYEPTTKEMSKHQKLSHKLTKGEKDTN